MNIGAQKNRWLTLIGGLCLCGLLVNCGGGDNNDENNSTENNSTENNTSTNNTSTNNTSTNNTSTNNTSTNNTSTNNTSTNNTSTNNTSTNNTSTNNTSTNNNAGAASLTFKATFGSNFGNQLPGAWRAPLGLGNDGDGPLVVMLCEASDTTCTSPVKTVEVAIDAPVQGSFGPDVEVTDLPEGEYLVMVFLDSKRSRDRGFGWEETPGKTIETDWGGHVSEFDIMMSDPDESPAVGNNPAPKPVSVMLSADAPAELGTIRMAHFHERRVDPVPEPENGIIAVVTESGLRVIDLNTFEVEDAGGGFRDYFLTDAQGNDLGMQGSICGMVKGAGTTIYVLYKGGTGAGFAVPFDVATRSQVGGGNLINFPGSGDPCAGTYHEHMGKQYLYLVNRGASGIDSGDTGMWYADITDLANGDVDGAFLEKDDDDLYEVGFNAVVAHGDKLYATMTPAQEDSSFVPADTVGNHTIFKAEIIPATGEPRWRTGGQYDYWTPMPSKDGVVRPDGNVDCVTSDRNGGTFAGLHKTMFQGKPILLLGGCSSISVFDLDADMQLDANPSPRSKDIDGTLFGHGFTRFVESPDGDILYALPQYKSQFHFYFRKDGDDSSRQTFNRYMILPLALDQGDAPALHPDFTGENIDGHEGTTNIGDKSTPGADPGIDINVGHLTRYQVEWAGSLAGSTNQSGSIPTGPSIAAGKNTIWLRGSGIPGNSGLAKGSNLMTYSVKERRAHLWTHNKGDYDWPHYYVWQGGNETDAPFGFDLTPETDAHLATYGLLYVSLD